MCDGSCMRSFHYGATVHHDSDVQLLLDLRWSKTDEQMSCNPLSMPPDLYLQLKAAKDPLLCPNCLTGIHQCFACKTEGVLEGHAKLKDNSQYAGKPVFR